MRWLRRLMGDHDGPPKVTLPAPRREPKKDHALRLPADPRIALPVEQRPEWRCPAERDVDGRMRLCGRPKTPEFTTCPRPQCKAWATRRAATEEPRGRVVAMPRRARG